MYSKGYVATNSARWSAQYYLWIHTCCLKTWSMIRLVTTSRYSCPRQKIKCRPHPTPQFDTERGPLWRVQIITLHEMEKVVLFCLEVRTCTYFMNGDNLFAQWLNVKIPESCCCQIHLAKSSRFPVLASPTTDKLDSSFSTHFRCSKKSL